MTLAMAIIPLLALATLIHLIGLGWLFGHKTKDHHPSSPLQRQPFLLMGGIVILHLAQAVLFAVAYLALGASSRWGDVGTLSVSAVAASLPPEGLGSPWQLFLPLQSLHGLLMLGWSIAFLVARARTVT